MWWEWWSVGVTVTFTIVNVGVSGVSRVNCYNTASFRRHYIFSTCPHVSVCPPPGRNRLNGVAVVVVGVFRVSVPWRLATLSCVGA